MCRNLLYFNVFPQVWFKFCQKTSPNDKEPTVDKSQGKTRKMQVRFTNRAMEIDVESDYMGFRGDTDGYRALRKEIEVSEDIQEESEYIYPQTPQEVYVDIVEYSDTIQVPENITMKRNLHTLVHTVYMRDMLVWWITLT